MFRFERIATVKNAADVPAALTFAAEVTSYLNKKYSFNVKFGFEMFGPAIVHWYRDVESLDTMAKDNAKLLQDRDYVEMLRKAMGLFVDGTLKDTIVSLVA